MQSPGNSFSQLMNEWLKSDRFVGEIVCTSKSKKELPFLRLSDFAPLNANLLNLLEQDLANIYALRELITL